jgi:abortive infection bacteriophage resistance protein
MSFAYSEGNPVEDQSRLHKPPARNICAHHSRFWNRELGYAPLLPNKNKFQPGMEKTKLKNTRSWIILMICRHMLALITRTPRWSGE